MRGTPTRTREGRLWYLALAMVITVGACSEDGTGPETGDGPAAVDDYVASLGSWEQFAPPVSSANEPAGDTSLADEVVEEPDVNGDLKNVTYQCTETPYSITDTPREIVMYEPNASIMWVGNLIQGASYKDGQGSFQELSIRQRDTLRLSIDLLTGDNFAEVPSPSLTTVQSAIGDLIQRATDAGHRAGSSIDYEEQLTYSVEQAALQLGLSARYLGGKAKTELNVSRAANERTLVAHFVQKMFTIAIELPQQPEDVFSDELTQEIWDQQVAAGNVGPNNLPVYIAQITYGRTLTYSLTSSHSEHRMQAAISASYDGLVGGGSGYTEAELRETLGQQNIKVTAIGGEGQNVLDLISSGDLKAYFNEDAALTSARPISYQLNFLGDNSIAKVAETSEYTLRECTHKPAAGGRFEFLALQESAAPVATPYRVLSGDLNGDGLGDLVWSHLTSGTNEFAVGFGQSDGTFDIRSAATHPSSPPEGWSSGFVAHVGDFDDDGMDDLVFNKSTNTSTNAIYLAISDGNGTFAWRDRIEHPAPSWGPEWETQLGDLDGQNGTDIVWSSRGNSHNYTWIAMNNGDGTFSFPARRDLPGTGWGSYRLKIGDINGDLSEDLIWNTVASHNRTYVGRSNGNGTFTLVGPVDAAVVNGWGNYGLQQGDINRDGRTDLIWTDLDPTRTPTPIHRALGLADARVSHLGWQGVDRVSDAPLAQHIGDFNGDGGADVLWNEMDVGVNHVWIGLGNVNGGFDFTPLDQEHPASAGSEDWTAFTGGVLVLDVDGDGRDDMVWNERGATNRIYVARARPAGS